MHVAYNKDHMETHRRVLLFQQGLSIHAALHLYLH